MKNIISKVEKKLYPLILFNLVVVAIQFIYIALRYTYLNAQIPLWLTMPWGEMQLADKSYIYLIPWISLLLVMAGLAFIYNAIAKYQRYGGTIILTIVTITNLLLAYSVVRIIHVSSDLFTPLINPGVNQIFLPAIVAFTVVYLSAPRFIEYLKDKGIVTDPKKHQHPGMVLVKPAVRGGGTIFTIGVLVTSIFFVKFSPMIIGILITTILAAILGYLDDIQNTSPTGKLAWLENPLYRFLMQIVTVLPLIISGVLVNSVNNPFNGAIHLDAWKFSMAGLEIAPIAIVFTLVWVIWIMNLLSWSNGVDGQYSGVIGIAGVMVAIITLRLLHFDPAQKDMMELAAIVAGAAFGLLPYGWYPAKVMWGFGAIAAGGILAALSVASQAKIATSIIVLAVPFLDGGITVARRLINKQSPFKGDRGHLHHLLLARGWGVRRVAVFYWISTALFGIAGIYAADRDPILTALTGAGIVAFVIYSLNVGSKK